MKSFVYFLAVFAIAANLCAQEVISQIDINKLEKRPDLLSAWKTLNDTPTLPPTEVRRIVTQLLASENDEIRLLVILKKRDIALHYLETNYQPVLSDSMLFAQALLANALSNQPIPGGEELSAQCGAIGRLSQMLKKSLSTSGTAAEGIKWEGETLADLVRWLGKLTEALLNDKSISDAQREAATKVHTLIAPLKSQVLTPVKNGEIYADIQPKPVTGAGISQESRVTERTSGLEQNEMTRSSSLLNGTVVLISIVAALGLLWLLLKRRS